MNAKLAAMVALAGLFAVGVTVSCGQPEPGDSPETKSGPEGVLPATEPVELPSAEKPKLPAFEAKLSTDTRPPADAAAPPKAPAEPREAPEAEAPVEASPAVVAGSGNSPRDTWVWSRPGKFLGARKCKSCHRREESGKQFTKWKKMKHAAAFASLASADARSVAVDRGIGDPQKAEQCLECHVTGNGLPAARFDRRFKQADGVQCESCHGPGAAHVKARKSAAGEGTEEKDDDGRVILGDKEIISEPGEKICRGCHNERSPNYKAFDFAEFHEKIKHLDPRKTMRGG